MAGTMKRLGWLGVAALSAASCWAATATVHALPAGSTPTGGQTISPASGSASTEITLALTAPNNVCPGDTATDNFRWNMYVVAGAVDVGTLTWTPGSAGPVDPAEGFAQALYSAVGGVPQVSKATAINTGQIVGTTTVDFLANTISGIGTYKVGFACSKAPALGQPAATERFWQTTIFVTAWASPTQFNWVAAPPMPPPTPPPPPPLPGMRQAIFATKAAPGALVIQQRCGTFGALPAVDDPDLGFLPGLAGNPVLNLVSTGCGVVLGTATLLSIGPRQGQFYGASGRIAQIEVLDTRQGNQPWTVSASISPFSNGGPTPNDSFSGNLLGWQPVVTSARDLAGNTDVNVIPGAAIEPSVDPSTGLPRTLATALPGKTAGFVQLDARLKLLIPATANNGLFGATMTFTVI